MEILLKLQISPEQLIRLMSNAINNISTFGWCSAVELPNPEWNRDLLVHYSEWKKKWDENNAWSDVEWHRSSDFYNGDFWFEVHEKRDDPLNPIKYHACNPEKIQKAFQIMFERYPKNIMDIINGHDNIFTADLFLQYVALGEYKYIS